MEAEQRFFKSQDWPKGNQSLARVGLICRLQKYWDFSLA
jgi:hypothetical protein